MKKTLAWLRAHRVAVLKGGWSRERAISLKTGAAAEQAFKRLGIPFQSIDVNQDIISTLQRKKIGFAFIALHGSFGEDGALQCILDFLKIPYIGSGPLASAVAMDKNLSKTLFVQHKVPTAPWLCVDRGTELKRIVGQVSNYPFFVKPADQGSAIGVSSAKNAPQLRKALKDCFKISERALIEQLIEGRELTVGILGDKALPVTEIIPSDEFYNFHSKYAVGGSRHITPAHLSKSQTKQIQAISLRAFKALGCAVYGRVDLMLSRTSKPLVLEVNTIPGMTATSLLPEGAAAAGLNFDDLVLEICRLSLAKRAAK